MAKLNLIKERFNIILLIIIALILAMHVFTLLRFPGPHGDEAWMASRAWELIKNGTSFGDLDKGVLDLFEGYQYFNPWLSSAIQSIGLRIFNEPSLLAIRSVSLISGLVLLVSIYFIGFSFDGKRLGILCVTLTAASWPFFLSAHFGRPDIIAATFGYISLAIYCNNRNSNYFLSALTGLISALAIEVHPNGAIFIPTIVALYIFHYGKFFLKRKDFLFFLGGACIGFLFFLIIHIFPSPSTYLVLSQIVFSESHIPPVFTLDYLIIWEALKSMFFMMITVYPQIILGLWAIIKLYRLRPSYLGKLYVLTGILLLSFIILVRNKFLLYYAIHYLPALCILLAAFFHEFINQPEKFPYERGIRYLFLFTIIVLPMPSIVRINPLPAYQKLQFEVKEVVRDGDVIMGNQLYWFEFSDHTYYSWENIPFHRRFKPESNLKAVFNLLEPDLFIIDSQINNFLLDRNEGNHYMQAFRIPKIEMMEFLNEYATLESTLEYFGNPVHIYRINLDRIQY
jgi:hypothetical protein